MSRQSSPADRHGDEAQQIVGDQIVGTWKLVSVMYEDQESKALTPIMGDNPRGFQIATKDGRWLALAARAGERSERPARAS